MLNGLALDTHVFVSRKTQPLTFLASFKGPLPRTVGALLSRSPFDKRQPKQFGGTEEGAPKISNTTASETS